MNPPPTCPPPPNHPLRAGSHGRRARVQRGCFVCYIACQRPVRRARMGRGGGREEGGGGASRMRNPAAARLGVHRPCQLATQPEFRPDRAGRAELRQRRPAAGARRRHVPRRVPGLSPGASGVRGALIRAAGQGASGRVRPPRSRGARRQPGPGLQARGAADKAPRKARSSTAACG